jgi:hypothetical protein
MKPKNTWAIEGCRAPVAEHILCLDTPEKERPLLVLVAAEEVDESMTHSAVYADHVEYIHHAGHMDHEEHAVCRHTLENEAAKAAAEAAEEVVHSLDMSGNEILHWALAL